MPHKGFLTRLLGVASIGLILLAFAPPVVGNAYVLEGGCKWPNQILYQNNAGGKYATPALNATQDWTNTPTPIYFVPYSNWYVDIRAVNHGNIGGADGITYWACNGITNQMLPPVYSDFNTYVTDNDSRYTGAALEQLMVHELGHAIGLDHSGSSSCAGQPIMYYSSSRYFTCGHVNPQQDDINGINSIYH